MNPTMNFLNGPMSGRPAFADARQARRFEVAAVVLAWICLGLAVAGGIDSLAAWFSPEHHGHGGSGVLPHQPLPVVLCFILIALGLLSTRYLDRAASLPLLLGVAVVGLGFFTVGPDRSSLWRVDNLTGWIILLAGFALGAGASRLSMIGYVRQFAIFVIFFLCGLILVGHFYEITEGDHYLSYIGTPWPAAVTGLVAGHALLFQKPDFGVMRLLSGAGFGSQLMRRLLPSMIVLLVLLGWMLALGEHRGWYPPSFGEGLYAVLAVTGFSGILMFTALSLNRIDGERLEREKDVFRQQAQLQAILDHTTSIVCMKDLEGRYLMVNKSFSDIFGKSPETCIGLTADDFYPPHIARTVRNGYDEAVRLRAPVEKIETYEIKGGSCSYLSARFPLLNAEGEPYAVCGIYTDITDIKRREEEIRGLNESLREKTRRQKAANEELEAFSYSVSHDLRAPLRHIAGFGQLLAQRNHEKLDEKSRHYLEVIQTSVQRMGALIDDLLSFSRASKVELTPKRVHTIDLIAEVRAEIEAGWKGPPISWEIGPVPDMRGDPSMLRLVWVNLLSNAAKYSGKNPAPRITVGFGAAGDEPGVFSVRDNGAGFDMRYADKLFGVFQRLHSAQEYDGTGIGLAMVRRILERHGGRIWAEAAPGEGACFYFVMPDNTLNGGAPGAPKDMPT